MHDVLDTFAYWLMKNYFHLLVRVKEYDFVGLVEKRDFKNGKGLHSSEHIISKKFSDMFNSYTKSINNTQLRTGGLFETPFRRILVDNDCYFTQLIWYIHHNPQKHGFTSDFRDYPYSSYHSHISEKRTKLSRAELVAWFDSTENLVAFHKLSYDEADFNKGHL